ncbi:immunoglobulin kappa light chain-like [Protopterus annectens]|uniref:immunoglobulin kappa light chain-like n=1 Tax=Protopterus annectens TaxID=7888 RepID=UPI001CFB1D7B|nr:immunoglobulin kappa light chain-like [Protopterus annectens]
MLDRVLLLFVCLTAVKTQVEQFPALVRFHPGDSVNLTCNILTSAAYCHDIVWYFQKYAEHPQRIRREQESSKSGGQLNKMCILKINNLTITDSGTYFCSLCWFTQSYFGNGTKLIVSGRTLTKPSIFITGPSQDMITLRLNVTLVCLVYDPPESMQIYWNVSGKHLTGGMGFQIISAEGDYSITNDLTLSYDTWINQPSIQCVTGEESKTYNYTMITEAYKVNETQVILVAVSAVLLIIVICTIIYYRRKLRLAQVKESDRNVWENSSDTNQAVIYQTVKGAGHTKKGKKRIKKKQTEEEYITKDIQYATLELHRK